ncbi:hypothetical protein GPL20_27755 [Bradyrhizobium cajani]|uniref:Uncharacterized protein n=1 Tax=Bradyrhizobium cajani TaxID=1928661 RepID=A0A844TCK8_9BRAD|nr:hypothetical protein [Bradyrhizobium cajani]
MCGEVVATSSSLRAQRSNPESFRGGSLDCFVARAPRNDGERASACHATCAVPVCGEVAATSSSLRAKRSRILPRRQSGLLRRKGSSQ